MLTPEIDYRREELTTATLNKTERRAWTPAEDAILEAYYDGSRGCVLKVARLLGNGRTPRAVRERAGRIGCNTGLTRLWKREDDEKLATLLERCSVLSIARIMKRSESGIRTRMWKLNLSSLKCRDYFIMTEVQDICGVSNDMVKRWIGCGWLKAKKRTGSTNPHIPWVITHEALKSFLRHHPQEVVGKPVDAYQIIEVLAGVIG